MCDPRETPQTASPIVELRVGVERFLVPEDDEGWSGDLVEADVPVLELVFRYGEVAVRAHEEQGQLFLAERSGLRAVARDTDFEARARRMLESFGAVEIACLQDYIPPHGSRADYVVRVDGDEHAFCSFNAYAVPQLLAMGWKVRIDDDYPYQVLSPQSSWYAQVDTADSADSCGGGGQDQLPCWFSFELGVAVDGQRVSLLPPLLDLLDRSEDLEQLLQAPSRYLAIPAGPNRYMPIPAERLRRVLQVVSDLYHGRASAPLRREPEVLELGADVRIPWMHATALPDLDEAFGDVGLVWEGSSAPRKLGASLASAAEELAGEIKGGIPGLRATLRSYQEAGVAWLTRLHTLGVGGILADDMGLGKTLQTIAFLQRLAARGELTRPALIIAPTSLVRGWLRELRKFAPGLRTCALVGKGRAELLSQLADHDVAVTSYPILCRDEELSAHPFGVIVLDEAQAIKNRSSLTHRRARQLDAEVRFCLTGTPVENNLGELYALLDFAIPGVLGTPPQFQAGFRKPIEAGDDEALDRLRRRVAPFILRRTKGEVLKELPPKTEIVLPVELPESQRELYESIRLAAHGDVRKLVKKRGLARSTVIVLDALMKLRQVCCDPRLVRVPAARRVQESAKLAALLELLERQRAEGRRVLVFSQFASMLAIIAEHLQERGIRHVSLTGATSDRQAQVDAFQGGEADVFLISLKAGGTGLTLTAAETVVHYDPWWNPAAQAQATDRAYRIGQTKPVFVYDLIVAGSVEERMLQLQKRKRQLANAIVGAGAAPAGGFAEEDIDSLFAPLD